MPPKARVTKDMVVSAAIEVVRNSGFESITARTVAERIGCSTQPVMYHFATIESLKQAAYTQIDNMHTAYLMDVTPKRDPLLGIGLNYVRFAVQEPQLFRFLFQSGYAKGDTLLEMIDSNELAPILAAMQEGLGMDLERTKDVFLTVALFAHGYASIIANNGLDFDEDLIATHLTRAWEGAVLEAQREGSR